MPKIYGANYAQSQTYHYVYRITNIIESKYYYGKRSSKLYPHLDLYHVYKSSSTDVKFKEDQSLNPENYSYKIVRCFPDSKSAMDFERILHLKFKVSRHLQFYNLLISGSCYDNADRVVVKDKSGKTKHVSKQEFDSDDSYVGVRSGMINLWRGDDTVYIPKSDEQEYKNAGWKNWQDGLSMYAVNGLTEKMLPEEAKKRGLVGSMYGRIAVRDSTGKTFSVLVDDPRIGKELQTTVGMPGFSTFKNKLGEAVSCHREDPRVLSGELVGITKGNIATEHRKQKMRDWHKREENRDKRSKQSSLVVVRDLDGSVLFSVDTYVQPLNAALTSMGVLYLTQYEAGESLFSDIVNPAIMTRGFKIKIGKLNRKSPNWRSYVGCTYQKFTFKSKYDRIDFYTANPEYKLFFVHFQQDPRKSHE